MTKGLFFLRYLVASQKLKSFCDYLSKHNGNKKNFYKYAHHVASLRKPATHAMKEFFIPIIPLSWWEEETTPVFTKLYLEHTFLTLP